MSQSGAYISGVGPGGPVTTLTGNSGGAVPPTAGNINVIGSGNITIAGNPGTSTLTATIVNTTNHAIQLGNASGSLTSLGVATNGQLPIGSAGADPVLATLTAGANVSITNGAGSITIAANSAAQVVNYTGVSTSPYVVLATDYYLGVDVTAGAITIQLPNAPTTGRIFAVKDKVGLAAANPITVTTVGGVVTLDGATSFVMNTAYESIQLIFNGTSYEVY